MVVLCYTEAAIKSTKYAKKILLTIRAGSDFSLHSDLSTSVALQVGQDACPVPRLKIVSRRKGIKGAKNSRFFQIMATPVSQTKNVNKLWCGAQETPPPGCHVPKGQKQQFHYILRLSVAIDGSTGLPEDHNQTKCQTN